MDWLDGSSTSIARFCYDSSASILTVEFVKGGTYNYFDVPSHLFDEMKAASSRGQFVAQRIKGSFRYARA
jgi:hypothetical protein